MIITIILEEYTLAQLLLTLRTLLAIADDLTVLELKTRTEEGWWRYCGPEGLNELIRALGLLDYLKPAEALIEFPLKKLSGPYSAEEPPF